MYKVILASKEIPTFEDLRIKTYRFHTDFTPGPIRKCDEKEGQKVRNIFKRYQPSMDMSIRRLDIDDFVTDQSDNPMSHLKQMYEAAPSINQLQNLSRDFPLVVRYRGVNYLLDGNTRTILIYYLGGKSITCYFYDLDEVL